MFDDIDASIPRILAVVVCARLALVASAYLLSTRRETRDVNPSKHGRSVRLDGLYLGSLR